MHLMVILDPFNRVDRSVFLKKKNLVKKNPLHFSGDLRIGESIDARIFLASNIVNFGHG